MYCCRKDFTEYIYHVGNASVLNSIIGNGLIPGGKSLKRGRQAVFFTVVNPMDEWKLYWWNPIDLTKPRIAPYKNTWKRLQNTVYWCNFKLFQERGLHFYQTRSLAVVPYDTLPADFIEKAVCMENTWWALPKGITKNTTSLYSDRIRNAVYLHGQEARSSWDTPSNSKS